MTTKITDLMMSDKPLSVGATALYPYSEKLEKRFTCVSRFDEVFALFQKNGAYIMLPRAVCPMGDEDQRIVGGAINCTSKVVPKNKEQARLINESADLLLDGQSFILRAPTGSGKSVIGCDLIAQVGRKTLIVVTKEDLIVQWRKFLLEYTDLTPDRIGHVQADKYSVVDKDVVIGMVHSLSIPERYPAWLVKEFGFVIVDEVHRLGAETFSRVASMFKAKLRLGLSATPERMDGKEIVFLAHIGPVRVISNVQEMVPKVLTYQSNWTCPRVLEFTPAGKKLVRMPHAPGKCGHVVNNLVLNQERNLLLAKLAYTCFLKNRYAVLFSDRLAHLDTLYTMIRNLGVPAESIGRYVGGMKQADLDKSKIKNVVLATYNMAKEGTNVPWWDACIFGVPRSDVVQIVGRIRREYPDKPVPVVFDVIDKDSPVFAGYARRRQAWYKDIKSIVKPMSVAALFQT